MDHTRSLPNKKSYLEIIMSKPEFKLLPCVFCTIGYNGYVAGHKLVSKTYQLIANETVNKDNLAVTESTVTAPEDVKGWQQCTGKLKN